ncbi:DUF4147 domain-containing protein [Caldichromatium japonicum]|uniref:DUF4147 domain-containing protein n=2 Tax=Caldichromatium japonicum TaxID=2699430 RepID=A0A6G7VB58_9GAMM|nr:DUF4147 domain-containing protein [Caldichromatium japonicum]
MWKIIHYHAQLVILGLAPQDEGAQVLSRIKGGGLLAQLRGRKVRQLAISDVPGDRAELIGSGPLVPVADLAAELRSLDLPACLRSWVDKGLSDATLPLNGPQVELVLSSAQDAVAAAARA